MIIADGTIGSRTKITEIYPMPFIKMNQSGK